jgi:hypothetical protein
MLPKPKKILSSDSKYSIVGNFKKSALGQKNQGENSTYIPTRLQPRINPCLQQRHPQSCSNWTPTKHQKVT